MNRNSLLFLIFCLSPFFCFAAKQGEGELLANPKYSLNITPTSCYGSQFTDGSIEVVPNATVTGPVKCSIDGGVLKDVNVFNNVAAGKHTIVVCNNGLCDTLIAQVTQPLRISAKTIPDTVIVQPGAPTQLGVSVQNFNSAVYSWYPVTNLSCTECFNPMATANQTTTYTVTVSEENNGRCFTTDSVLVIVLGGVVMPDAFTPNGDGSNDKFGPVPYGNVTVKDFKIYTRWGELVHNSIEAWDGRFDEKDQVSGTYQYFISIETPDPDKPGMIKNTVKQGSVSLLR